MAHLSNILDISGPVEEMFERSPEIPNFGTTNPFRCRHVVTKFPQLDLEDTGKGRIAEVDKGIPQASLRPDHGTMGPWNSTQAL